MEELVTNVNSLLFQGYTLKECAIALNIHRTTLWRQLCQSEDWDGVHCDFTLQEACCLIMNTIPLRGHGATWGIRLIHDRLRRMGYKITRAMVHGALKFLMPELLEQRRQRRLIRREYDVYVPMQVWHIDSHDKLARWGFRIHGAIDGATHYVVYMLVCTNKRMETIYNAYREAVDKFGHPIMVRSDGAVEHNLIQADMLQARPNTHAFHVGPSVHNQRIEAFWRMEREKVSGYYQEALTFLSRDEGSLQINDPWHRTSVVKVFLPVLEYAITDFIATWNCHKVRAINQRGCHRPAHIPEMTFQAIQRQDGSILPPVYPDGANTQRIHNTQDFLHPDGVNDGGQFETGMLDLEDQGLRHVRDLAYFNNHDRLELITCKFKLHLALTLECKLSFESGLPLRIYLQNKLLQPQVSPGMSCTKYFIPNSPGTTTRLIRFSAMEVENVHGYISRGLSWTFGVNSLAELGNA